MPSKKYHLDSEIVRIFNYFSMWGGDKKIYQYLLSKCSLTVSMVWVSEGTISLTRFFDSIPKALFVFIFGLNKTKIYEALFNVQQDKRFRII